MEEDERASPEEALARLADAYDAAIAATARFPGPESGSMARQLTHCRDQLLRHYEEIARPDSV